VALGSWLRSKSADGKGAGYQVVIENAFVMLIDKEYLFWCGHQAALQVGRLDGKLLRRK
jgi:hypothetical protein